MFNADEKVSRLCSSFDCYEPIIIIIKRNEEETCDSTYVCEEIYVTRENFVTRSDRTVSIKIMLLSHIRRLTIKIMR